MKSKQLLNIKLKNKQLSEIDKIYINDGQLFKKVVCRDRLQRVDYRTYVKFTFFFHRKTVSAKVSFYSLLTQLNLHFLSIIKTY